jgi:hypothetical protein
MKVYGEPLMMLLAGCHHRLLTPTTFLNLTCCTCHSNQDTQSWPASCTAREVPFVMLVTLHHAC